MKIIKLPYITLWSQNFQQEVIFYEKGLNLNIIYRDDNLVQLELNNCRLYIHRLEGTTDTLRSDSVDIHFEVSDVDSSYQELLLKGIIFEQPPANMPWGTRQAWFKDPEGYRVELVGPIKAGEPIITH